MVHAVEITFSLNFSLSLNSRALSVLSPLGDISRGLLEPDVAMAKAAAALEVLFL